MKTVKHASVMIIDTNPRMCGVMRGILKAFPVARVSEARTAEDAIRAVNTTPVDIILLDYQLDTMTGAELTWTLRHNLRCMNRTTPVLLLASTPDREAIITARDAGAHEILAKPVNPRNLYLKMHGVLAHPRKFIVAKTYVGPCRRRQNKDFPPELERRGDQLKRIARQRRPLAGGDVAARR